MSYSLRANRKVIKYLVKINPESKNSLLKNCIILINSYAKKDIKDGHKKPIKFLKAIENFFIS